MADEVDYVEIRLEDGCRIRVRAVIADRIRGVDADGDLVVPLGTDEAPSATTTAPSTSLRSRPAATPAEKAPNPAPGWCAAPATAKSPSSTASLNYQQLLWPGGRVRRGVPDEVTEAVVAVTSPAGRFVIAPAAVCALVPAFVCGTACRSCQPGGPQ